MSYIFCFHNKKNMLLYNALEGQGCILSSNAFNYFDVDNKGTVVGCSASIPLHLKKYLSKKNLLDFSSDKTNNELYLKKRLLYASEGKLIGSIRLTITRDCNCFCDYCYVNREYGKNLHLNATDCLDFIEKIIKISNLTRYSIRFFGGEPTLFFDVIKEIVCKLEILHPDICFDYTLNTNLQVISKYMVNFLTSHSFKVVVSLDGCRLQNDHFRHSLVSKSYYLQVIDNLKLIQNFCTTNLVIASVVTNSNKNDLIPFLMEMKEIGIKHIGLNCARMCSSDVLDYDNYLADQLFDAFLWGERNGITVSGYWYLPFERIMTGSDYAYCGGLGHELDLRPDGNIYSCVGSNDSLGNLIVFDNIFNSSKYLEIVGRIAPFIEECDGCMIQGLCAGECACNAKYVTNNTNSIDTRVCNFQKAITEKLIFHYLDSFDGQ